MNRILFLACAAALSANAKTIQMPPTCTTPDGMCVDSKGRLVIATPNNDRTQPGAVFRLDKPCGTPVKWFDVPPCKDSGYASAEAMFAEMGSDFNSTINETVDSSVSQEMIDQMVASFVSKGTYEIEDGKLYSAPEGTELNKEQYETYKITADTLKLLSYVGDTAIKDDAGNDTGMSIDPTTLYPITFTKVK
jgi:hypothetical protein